MIKAKRGFSLMEIMIVVAIISVLVSIAIVNLLRARMDANEVAAKATLKTLATACETYANENSFRYPTAMSDLTGASLPYFRYDLTAKAKQGYKYTADFADDGSGYTVTAEPQARAGSWAYQITPGLTLKRSAPGENDWQLFD